MDLGRHRRDRSRAAERVAFDGIVAKQESREEHSVQTLVPRQEMTGADRGWAQQYQVNDIVRYSRSSQETDIQKGEYTRVVSVNTQENALTVLGTNGEKKTYDH